MNFGGLIALHKQQKKEAESIEKQSSSAKQSPSVQVEVAETKKVLATEIHFKSQTLNEPKKKRNDKNEEKNAYIRDISKIN